MKKKKISFDLDLKENFLTLSWYISIKTASILFVIFYFNNALSWIYSQTSTEMPIFKDSFQ